MSNFSTKLNLGCGQTYMEGFVNVDFHSHVKTEVTHDLNSFPYPLPDQHFEYILASHIIEHLDKPFEVMKELHRIMKPGAKLVVKVPHWSRGFTHPEHKSGFDVTFPLYFDKNFSKSGYYGVDFGLVKMEMHYIAFWHLLPYLGVSKTTIAFMKPINATLNFFANLNQKVCSRIWCQWVGGFEEIEFIFVKPQ